VVALRSQALIALSGTGGMLSVASPVDELTVPRELSVAVVNSADSCVISGPRDALAAFAEACGAAGIRTRLLAVDYASHSPAVQALRERIMNDLAGIEPSAPRVVMVSSMTGQSISDPLDAGYWYASLRAPVRFDQAVETLLGQGLSRFVEVSAHPVLAAAIDAPVVVGSLRRDDGGATRLLTSFAEAWTRGVGVDWTKVLPAAPRVDLPTYPFQHQRFWPQPVDRPEVDSSLEAGFWAAVDGGDAAAVAAALDAGPVVDSSLRVVLPALSSWRRAQRDRSAVDAWRYRTVWKPVATPAPRPVNGSWLVLAPAGGVLGSVVEVLQAMGAKVTVLDPGTGGRAELAARILAALAGRELVVGGVAGAPTRHRWSGIHGARRWPTRRCCKREDLRSTPGC
jgi:acyl transferase domain-containing protein